MWTSGHTNFEKNLPMYMKFLSACMRHEASSTALGTFALCCERTLSLFKTFCATARYCGTREIFRTHGNVMFEKVLSIFIFFSLLSSVVGTELAYLGCGCALREVVVCLPRPGSIRNVRSEGVPRFCAACALHVLSKCLQTKWHDLKTRGKLLTATRTLSEILPTAQ